MIIADLHCDLLCYLAGGPTRSPFDAAVRCSLPQMQQGGVALQVLPVFTETGSGSTLKGANQVRAFDALLRNYSELVHLVHHAEDLKAAGTIGLLLSIENASGFFEESEPLTDGFKRLEGLLESYQRVAYISLTWNTENRFGGGALTDVGLKEDGKALLEFMHGRRIAFDASHTSDRLMREALAYIDKGQLDIPVIASHSNMRAVTDVPRNLPDALAREILQRGGIIGLNLYRPFVGAADDSFLVRQLEHVMRLGGETQVCFGADFFWDDDLPPAYRKPPLVMFYPEVTDSSCYPYVLNLWKKQLGLPPATLRGIAFDNLTRYLAGKILADKAATAIL